MRAAAATGALLLWVAAGCGGGVTPEGHDPFFLALPLEQQRLLISLAPPQLPPAPPDPTNRFADDPAAAALGQALFFDPGFSGALLDPDNDGSAATLGTVGQTGRVSCAGCHEPGAGFADARSPGQQVSLAAGWGVRRAPSLLGVGQAKLLMWDGSKDALFNQVFGPLESPLEMNSSRLYAAQQLANRYRPAYESVFGPLPPVNDPAQYPQLTAQQTGCQPNGLPTATCNGTRHGMPGDNAEYDSLTPGQQDAVTGVVVNMGKALGAYERQLSCGRSRFDAWVNGQPDALSPAEKRGAALFVGKAGCVRCHSGPGLTDQEFHNVGLQAAPVAVAILDGNDPGAAVGLAAALGNPLSSRSRWSDGYDGRLPASVPASDSGAFRTPSLRCVAERPSFMHTGQKRSLLEVVDFFNWGGDPGGFVGASELAPLGLTLGEESDLVAFLESLNGPGPDPSLLRP